MLLNYHELTIDEPRNSLQQKKQFLVVTVGGFAVLLNALVHAGLFEPVQIYKNGIYPGGEFVYKQYEGDYASTGGLMREVKEDLGIGDYDPLDKGNGLVFSVFLDNMEVLVPSGKERSFTGILIDKTQKDLKKILLEKKTELTEDNENLQRSYTVGDLPSVKSFVVKFAYTDGFISALIHTYKIFPALIKYAKKHNDGNRIVISSTCSIKQRMCTHYVPLRKGNDFFLARPSTESYVRDLPKTQNSG